MSAIFFRIRRHLLSLGSVGRFTGFCWQAAFREIAVKNGDRRELRDFWAELLLKNPEDLSDPILLTKTAFYKIADPLI